MKKFSIKSLLVLVLVLVLVLSIVLVSCNKKKENNNTEPTQPQQTISNKDWFFPNMWDIANDIGGEAISASDNIAVSLDLALQLKKINNSGNEVENADGSFNIGVKLDIAYDRNSVAKDENNQDISSTVNTGLRALVYDIADENKPLFAVYYMISDPTNVYLDLSFAKKIDFLKDNNLLQNGLYKVHFETDDNGNASYAHGIADFIDNHKFGEEKNDKGEVTKAGFTIRNIIDALAKDTGANWTLNNLIDNVTKAAGLDLGNLLSKISGMIPGVYDAQTGIHIEAALASSFVKALLNEPTTQELEGGKKVHTVALKISGLLNLLGDSLPAGLSKFLNKDTAISVSYGEKDGKIDGFGLTVGMKSLKDSKTSLYPELSVNINNLEIRKVANNANAVKDKLGFKAEDWTGAKNINLNSLLNAKAEMKIEVWDEGDSKQYLATAYSHIEITDIIEGAIKMSSEFKKADKAYSTVKQVAQLQEESAKLQADADKESDATKKAALLKQKESVDKQITKLEKEVPACKTEAAQHRAKAVQALKEIDAELGFKIEELDSEGEFVKDANNKHVIPFQILVSCPQAEASVVFDGKSYIIDVADILSHLDEVSDEIEANNKAEKKDQDEEVKTEIDEKKADVSLSALTGALDIITGKVKINGKELSLDNLQEAFFKQETKDGKKEFVKDAKGNYVLKSDWHEFTLDANFTKAICDELCAKFGVTNDNNVSVNIQKGKDNCHIVVKYLNEAGKQKKKDSKGNVVKDKYGNEVMEPVMKEYYIDITSSWDVAKLECKLTLKFTAWDKDANAIREYTLVLDGGKDGDTTLPAKIVMEGTNKEFFKSLTAHANLTTVKLDKDGKKVENSQEEWFDANLTISATYKDGYTSIASGTLALAVTKGGTPLFNVNANLVVGDGSVLVKFVKDENGNLKVEYSAENVTVDTTITEDVIKYAFGEIKVKQDNVKVALKNAKLPDQMLSVLKFLGMVENNVDSMNVTEFVDLFNLKTDSANVIKTHYTQTHTAAQDEETFRLGVNEREDPLSVAHVDFVFRRAPKPASEQVAGEKTKYDITYVKFVWNTGDGDTGIALDIASFEGVTYKQNPNGNYLGLVSPADRTDATILNAENYADFWKDLKAFFKKK